MLAVTNETETLARLLARKTGKTPEDVIHDAVAASARALGVTQSATHLADQDAMIRAATAIVLRSSGTPILDTRAEDEILGYDEFGIPR
jgi:hypothetical protein